MCAQTQLHKAFKRENYLLTLYDFGNVGEAFQRRYLKWTVDLISFAVKLVEIIRNLVVSSIFNIS